MVEVDENDQDYKLWISQAEAVAAEYEISVFNLVRLLILNLDQPRLQDALFWSTGKHNDFAFHEWKKGGASSQ